MNYVPTQLNKKRREEGNCYASTLGAANVPHN